ncbi:hypothetical protein D3C73_1433110 [compost metagenome]
MHNALGHNYILTCYHVAVLDEGYLHILPGTNLSFIIADDTSGNFNRPSGNQLGTFNSAYNTDIARRFDGKARQHVAADDNRSHKINITCTVVYIPVDLIYRKDIDFALIGKCH